jgi:hypothetical protein
MVLKGAHAHTMNTETDKKMFNVFQYTLNASVGNGLGFKYFYPPVSTRHLLNIFFKNFDRLNNKEICSAFSRERFISWCNDDSGVNDVDVINLSIFILRYRGNYYSKNNGKYPVIGYLDLVSFLYISQSLIYDDVLSCKNWEALLGNNAEYNIIITRVFELLAVFNYNVYYSPEEFNFFSTIYAAQCNEGKNIKSIALK